MGAGVGPQAVSHTEPPGGAIKCEQRTLTHSLGHSDGGSTGRILPLLNAVIDDHTQRFSSKKKKKKLLAQHALRR